MVYKLRVLDEAIVEVQEAILWYNDISNTLSADIESRFYLSLDDIQKQPETYPKLKKNFRQYNIGRFPYNVVYRLKGNLIIVLAFAHHKRKPNYWRKRI